LSQVEVEDIQSFLNSKGDSKETAKKRMSELRRLFAKGLLKGFDNPMDDDALKMPEGAEADNTVSRSIFTVEELKKIYAVAEGHWIYPLIVVAVGTGLRKRDVCCLKWESVKLDEGLIQVTTNKTGSEIHVPISKRMEKVFENRLPVGEYCFPEVAEMYLSGRNGRNQLTKALKNVLFEALAEKNPQATELSKLAPAKAYVKALEAIQGMDTTPKRKERFKDVLHAYLIEAKSYNQIQDEHSYSKAQISESLKIAEKETGCQLVRNPQGEKTLKTSRLTTKQVEGRKNRQSVYDWHSFRTTWVTRALEAGWTVPQVQQVTGHGTVDVVLKHYFKQDKEHLKSLPVPASAAV
jgi:integrase